MGLLQLRDDSLIWFPAPWQFYKMAVVVRNINTWRLTHLCTNPIFGTFQKWRRRSKEMKTSAASVQRRRRRRNLERRANCHPPSQKTTRTNCGRQMDVVHVCSAHNGVAQDILDRWMWCLGRCARRDRYRILPPCLSVTAYTLVTETFITPPPSYRYLAHANDLRLQSCKCVQYHASNILHFQRIFILSADRKVAIITHTYDDHPHPNDPDVQCNKRSQYVSAISPKGKMRNVLKPCWSMFALSTDPSPIINVTLSAPSQTNCPDAVVLACYWKSTFVKLLLLLIINNKYFLFLLLKKLVTRTWN